MYELILSDCWRCDIIISPSLRIYLVFDWIARKFNLRSGAHHLPYEHIADARENQILTLLSPLVQLPSKTEVSDNVPQLSKGWCKVLKMQMCFKNLNLRRKNLKEGTNRWSKSESEGIKEVLPTKVDPCILNLHPDSRL